MGKNRETFMELVQMREFYPPLTKKELATNGKEAAKQVLDNGDIEPTKALVNAARLKEWINSFEQEIRSNISIVENQTENGVEIQLGNTGDRLDYEKDDLYCIISRELKERTELLKLAFKSKDVIFDSEGVEVPKVPVKSHSKEFIKLKF